MSVEIKWSDVVDKKTVYEGGYIGDLMELASAEINKAMDDGILTQSDAGQVFAAALQASMQEGLKFALEKQLLESQTDTEQARTATEQDKLLTADKNRNSIDKQITLTQRQIEGYDDDRDQKVLDTTVKGHAMIFEALQGSDTLPAIPKYYTNNDEFEAIFNAART